MKPAAAPCVVFIRPSRRLLRIQSVAHAVAAAAVVASALPSWLAAGLLILIGASLAYALRTSPIESLVLRGDGRLEIVGAGGTANDATVDPQTFVLSFLVVLMYRQDGRMRSLTLLADNLAVDDFRQLRLWLRWRFAATTLD